MQELAAKQTGKIKWYSVEKNFGFVITDSGLEIFLHHASIVYDGAGHCEHNRGICARAMSLLSEAKQRHAQSRQSNHEFNTRTFEKELEGFPTSRGAIRFPSDKPLPDSLLKKIVNTRVAENKEWD